MCLITQVEIQGVDLLLGGGLGATQMSPKQDSLAAKTARLYLIRRTGPRAQADGMLRAGPPAFTPMSQVVSEHLPFAL